LLSSLACVLLSPARALEAAQRDDVGQAGAICEVDEGEARPVQREARNHVAIPHTHTQPGAGTDRHDQTRHI